MATEITSTENDSLQYRDDGDAVYDKMVDVIEGTVSPVVIVVGLAGNAVGAATLLRVAGLRCRGIGHLLVAICVADAIFLASLLPMWAGRRYGRRYDLHHRDGWCELLSLTTMSSNFLSTWFTVALGAERYFAVRYCLRHALAVDGRENPEPTARTSCGPIRTRVAIIALTVLAIVVFVNMVVNFGATTGDDGVQRCVPLKSAVDAMRVLSNIDLVFNVIAPNLVIAGLYAASGVRLAIWHCRRGRLAPPRPAGHEDDRAESMIEIRLTKTAVLLSAVVMLLSVPSQAARTAYVVAGIFRLPVPARIGGMSVQLVVRELFYASFAVPFFVVVASHGRIRRFIVLSVKLALESVWKGFQVACCCCSSQASSMTTQNAAV